MVLGVSGEIVALVAFLVGVAVVIVSVEAFIEAVAEAALAVGVSGFFLTVVLAGIDLENAILGMTAAAGDLPGLALGTVFGEALFVLGAAVGVAGLFVPFETDVPRNYVGLILLTPFIFFGLALDGTLSRLDGAILVGAFLPCLAIVYVLERHAGTRYLSAEEIELAADARERTDDDGGILGSGIDPDLDIDELVEGYVPDRHQGAAYLGIAVLASVGMVVGSEIAVSGAETLLTVLGVTGLAFGATVMSFVASLEELFLTVEPVRQGRPHIGVGNVVGSLLFFVSANAGVIALIRPLDTTGTVLTVHWPFLFATLAVVSVAFLRGKIGRPTGVVLLVVYAGYWVANYGV